MQYQQIKAPNLSTIDLPGWCLRLVLHAYGFSTGADCARAEWDRNTTRRGDALPDDVAVPVFYSWVGTIDGITRDWGDVAIHVPGRGVFGTPKRGSGNTNRWDPSVQARAAWLGGGARYLGWTESLNGTKLIELLPPPRKDLMSDEDCINLCRAMLGRFDEAYPEPSHGWLRAMTGKPFAEVHATLVNHPEHVALLHVGNAVKLLARVGE